MSDLKTTFENCNRYIRSTGRAVGSMCLVCGNGACLFGNEKRQPEPVEVHSISIKPADAKGWVYDVVLNSRPSLSGYTPNNVTDALAMVLDHMRRAGIAS